MVFPRSLQWLRRVRCLEVHLSHDCCSPSSQSFVICIALLTFVDRFVIVGSTIFLRQVHWISEALSNKHILTLIHCVSLLMHLRLNSTISVLMDWIVVSHVDSLLLSYKNPDIGIFRVCSLPSKRKYVPLFFVIEKETWRSWEAQKTGRGTPEKSHGGRRSKKRSREATFGEWLRAFTLTAIALWRSRLAATRPDQLIEFRLPCGTALVLFLPKLSVFR